MVLKVHPCCDRCQNFFERRESVPWHIYIVFLSVHLCMLGWLPPSDCVAECCPEHGCANICPSPAFLSCAILFPDRSLSCPVPSLELRIDTLPGFPEWLFGVLFQYSIKEAKQNGLRKMLLVANLGGKATLLSLLTLAIKSPTCNSILGHVGRLVFLFPSLHVLWREVRRAPLWPGAGPAPALPVLPTLPRTSPPRWHLPCSGTLSLPPWYFKLSPEQPPG